MYDVSTEVGYFGLLAPEILDNGYHVVPIKRGTKRPAVADWQTPRSYDLKQYADYGIGIICGQGAHPAVAIDIDVTHPATLAAAVALCERLFGAGLVRRGARGLLLLFRAAESGWSKVTGTQFFDPAEPTKPGTSDENVQKVEVLGHGQQFVAYAVHPDTGRPYGWEGMFGGPADLPAHHLPVVTWAQLQELLREFEALVRATPGLQIRRSAQLRDELLGGDMLRGVAPRRGRTLQQIRETLFAVPADCSRDDWFTAVAAVHHETCGSEEGLDLVDEWSSTGGDKYKGRRDVAAVWRSLGKGPHAPYTIASLDHMARECAGKQRYTAAAEWKQRIAEAGDEYTLREQTCPKIIGDIRLGEIEREALAQVLCDRFRALGTKLPIAQCRKLLAPKRLEKVNNGGPEWLQGWVYVEASDKFHCIETGESLTSQAFDMRNNRLCPTDAHGEVIAGATKLARDSWHIETVFHAMYFPPAGVIFTHDGKRYVNSYRPSSVPTAAPLDSAGRAAIERVCMHVRLIAGGRPEVVAALLSWIAYNVQKPGAKIRWAPIIKGIEGDGKTVLGELLRAVMGHPQVQVIHPQVLATQFSGWAEGACVGVLEEVRIVGANRHDVFNVVKPFITNDIIEVHRKGQDAYQAVNTQNYLACTNFNDALPLSDTDRRWMVIFTPWGNLEEFAGVVGTDPTGMAGYFTALHHAIATYAGALRTWLLEYQLDATFNPNGPAPLTAEKAQMTAAAASPEEDAVRSAIEEGGLGVGKKVLSSACLTSRIDWACLGLQLNTTAVSRVLTRLGWLKVPAQLKWKGSAHRIWTRPGVPHDPAVLRHHLDETTRSQVAQVGTEMAAACDPLSPS